MIWILKISKLKGLNFIF